MDTRNITPTPWRPADLPTLRAAYSDRTAALMAYLAAFAYDARIETKGPIGVPAELAQLGFTGVTSFHNGMTDGWAYIAEGSELVVLSFRGTVSIANWQTNFHVRFVRPDHADRNLRVHEGFYQAFLRLDADRAGMEAKTKIEAKINEIKTSTQGAIPIYVTGHSLGGALAQIAAAVLGNDQFAACYTFGSPRVGNSYFDSWVKVPSYRVVNYADIVPQVPLPIVYRHSGDVRYMPNRVLGSPYRFEPSPLARASQLVLGLVQLLRSRTILGIEDHAIAGYCSKLDEIAAARQQSR